MKIDVYTRVMLTIIACCLVWLCLDAPFSLQAQTQGNFPQGNNPNGNRVLVAGWVDETGSVRLFPGPSPAAGNALPVSQR